MKRKDKHPHSKAQEKRESKAHERSESPEWEAMEHSAEQTNGRLLHSIRSEHARIVRRRRNIDTEQFP